MSPRSPVDLLVFDLGRQRFGIVLAAVSEVVRAVALARLPKAPAVVEGIINLRGTIVPVLDIRARFRLPAKTIEISDHLVVARAGPRIVAIRADRVVDVLAVDPNDIDDAKLAAVSSAYVSGVAKLPGGLLLIHDLATFLSGAEEERLDEIEALHA
jgi:purine-binding chemotaxis protein CheW